LLTLPSSLLTSLLSLVSFVTVVSCWTPEVTLPNSPPVVAKGPEVVDLKEKARLEQLKVQQATVAELGKVTSGVQQLTTVTKETKESKEVRSEEGSVNKNLAGIPRDIMTYMFGLEPDGTTSTGLI
jgi:hypothetical protein